MGSKAGAAFNENLADVANLVEFYRTVEDLAEGEAGMPEGSDVVLRSAIVLLVTYWEAYIEDIAAEALDHLVEHIPDGSKLPKALRKLIAKELKEDKNELAIWTLSGDGWRRLVKDRLPRLTAARNRAFNSPRSAQTQEFIEASIGVSDIRSCWVFQGKTPAQNGRTLDALVEVRGTIAHRGKLARKVTPDSIVGATKFVGSLVGKTGGRINTEIKKLTGKPLW